MIWPSDSVSQCRVQSSQTHDDDEEYEDQFSGDSLSEEMGRLVISIKGKGPSTSAFSTSSSASSSSLSSSRSESSEQTSTRMQQQCRKLPELDEMLLNRGSPSYKSLGSDIGTQAIDSQANAAFRSHNNSMMRSERSKTQRRRGGFGDAEVSPELVTSIFGSVSKEVRGRRFALLMMDDESGRWRVAHSQIPAKTFPGNEK